MIINAQLGIDTWEGQLEIDEGILKSNNVKFMFIRLNDISGGHHKDTGFDKQWAEAAGFYRAPYFVYNPWVNGQGNYNWLVANMPADAFAVASDMEVAMTGYSPVTYANEYAHFRQLVKTRWHHITYTGQAYLPLLSYWDPNEWYWWAEYPNEFYPSTTVNMSWGELRTRLEKYSGPLNAAYVPGKLACWQFSGDRIIAPGNSRRMDFNVWLKTADEMATFFGGAPVQEPAVIHTRPFSNVDEYIEIVNGERCHITVLQPTSNTRIRVKHFNGALGLVSQSAKQDNSQIVFNGEDYNKKLPAPYYPQGMAWVEGKQYTSQQGFQYFMNMSSDNKFFADFKNFSSFYNTISFIRPLVINGAPNPDFAADPAKLEYTEIHARSGLGFTPTGALIQIVAEGKADPLTSITYRGITEPQMAALFIKYGALFAGSSGGGGDAGKAINGVMVNAPSDPTERPVVQIIEIFIGEQTNMTTYTVTAKADGVKIYKNADGSAQIATLNMGQSAKADGLAGAMLHIISLKGAPLQGYVYTAKVNYTPDAATPPPVVDPPIPPITTTHHIKITIDGVVIEDKDFTLPS